MFVVSVSVLGELEVMVDGVVVALPRGLARSLVMSLVVDIDRTVTDEDLIERLWGGAAPANAHFSLRNTVSRLRSLLGHDVIERDDVGYRMPSSAVRTDLADLDRLVAAGDVETALGLVRGPAFAAVRHEHWALRAVAEADERVAAAEESWAEQRLANGRLGSELGRVRAQALDKPMRETRWRQLVDALVLEARRAEALRAAHDARQALAQYGMVAGPDLRAAEQRALADPSEDRPVGTPGAMSLEAARAWPVVGRDEVVRALSNSAFDRVISWVVGPIGVGVSRVLAEVAAMAREQGALVCAVDVEAAGRGQRTLAALGAELRAARLLAMPGSEASVDASVSSPMPEVREGRLRNELVRDLVDLADVRPLVVVLDDVHLLTTADAAAVAHLVAAVVDRSLPVAFVCGEEVDVVGSGGLRSAVADEVSGLDVESGTVALGQLAGADVLELVRRLAPDLGSEATRSLAESVMGATLGHPLYAAELIRHQLASGAAAPLSVSVEDAIHDRLSRLGPAAVDVVRVIAAAGRPVSGSLVAEATPATKASARAAIQRLLDERLLVELDGGRLDIRMPALTGIASRSLAWSEVTRIRRRLVDILEAQADDPLLLAHLLLDLRSDRPKEHRKVDEHVRDVLERLVHETDFDGVVVLGRKYLSAVGAVDANDRVGLEIRVLIATALFATGGTAEANSLVEVVTAKASVFGFADLVADALLARGPIDTGSSDAEQIAERAAAVLPLLDANDIERRVRLSCWAAHHRFNIGHYQRGVELLDSVEHDVANASRPLWRSLLLTMRVQQHLCLEGRLRPAVAALEELRAWHRLTNDESAAIGSATMGLSVASAAGTLDDVRSAAETIREASRSMPRPDLRWLPEAAHAAALLAANELEAAERAVGDAEALGERLSVGGARAASTSQRLLLMLESGGLGAFAPLMAPFGDSSDVPAALVGTWALACVQAGDREAAARAASMLSAGGSVLRGVGAAWPLVAMCAAEAAAFVGHAETARLLFEELRPWTGAGLSVFGLVHLGPADLWLGLAAATIGQRATAERLLDAAIDRERRSGGAFWEKRALLARERLDAMP
mgnify:CR=1 FL=1